MYLEESKFCRVIWGGLVKSLQSLDNNMRMSNNDTLSIQLLWGWEVIFLSVDKVTSL